MWGRWNRSDSDDSRALSRTILQVHGDVHLGCWCVACVERVGAGSFLCNGVSACMHHLNDNLVHLLDESDVVLVAVGVPTPQCDCCGVELLEAGGGSFVGTFVSVGLCSGTASGINGSFFGMSLYFHACDRVGAPCANPIE